LLVVPTAEPFVVTVTAVVDVPEAATARSLHALNCVNASISKYFRASSRRVLSMILVTSCLSRASSLPVYGTEFPAS